MDTQILRSFRVELEKISARRGLKEIRKMVGSGHAEQAAALARKPGVLKPTVHGHQVRDIGRGSEGLATLTAGPEHGLAVRKTYDPKGIATPDLIARKEQAGRAMGANPHVAQFHGAQQGKGGTTAHTMEYVQGHQPVAKLEGKRNPDVARATQGIAKGMRGAGFAGATDIRPENMIQTPKGAVKAIDYIPIHKGEFASGNIRNRLNQQRVAGGMRPVGKNMQIPMGDSSPLQNPTGATSAGQLKALHFRGVQPTVGTPAPAMGQQPTRVEQAPTRAHVPAPVMPKGNVNPTKVLSKI